MSKVYVLNIGHDYEGEETLGVYACADSAMKAAKLIAVDRGNAEPEDELEFRPARNCDTTLVAEKGSATWYVYEMEIEP